MSFLSAIPIIGNIIDAVSDHQKGKQRLKQAKVDGEIRVIEAAADNLATWELLHAKGSQTSWKDEFWTIIFAIPLVLGFTGEWGVGITTAGFKALSEMPDWYQYTLVTMVLAAFGIRMKDSLMSKLKR